MNLYRVLINDVTRLALKTGQDMVLLPPETTIASLLSLGDLSSGLASIEKSNLESEFTPLAPLEDQDVWACGVTYYDSKLARNDESENASSFYDAAYSASRPLIFFKARGRNVLPTGGKMLLRSDSSWIVPEPELVLVINSSGKIVGVTAGNDLSCRDIEGENPLYQPQAKVWKGSCSMGPSIYLVETGSRKDFDISMSISRNSQEIFSGQTNSSKIVREF